MTPNQLQLLEKHYQEIMEFNDITLRQYNVPFRCRHCEQCNVNTETESIWSALVDGCKIMIIGEAPSKGDPLVIHANIAGGTANPANIIPFSDGHQALRRFVGNPAYFNYDKPYMTEVAKCGVRDKRNPIDANNLKIRLRVCSKYFLHREIEIIQPKIILCVGSSAYYYISLFNLPPTIECIKLEHFSREARRFKLEEKEHLIWPIQSGFITSPIKLSGIANARNGIYVNPGMSPAAWNCIWERRHDPGWLTRAQNL